MSKDFRPHQFNYPSRRSELFARNIVSTSQPLAAQAGIDMLKQGGNAIDAALATAICLTVVEPTMNGIGSDAFALVWHEGKLFGFNGSGRAPAAWSPQRFSGLQEMPETGWDTITVPGAVDTWKQMSERFGALRFEKLFEPAIHYAEQGFHVTPVVQRQWHNALESLGQFPAFADTFTFNGRAPVVGELFKAPDHARTLGTIALSKGEEFYRGGLAEAMIRDSEAHGGAMRLEDLASHAGEWVDPISIEYGEIRVNEIPPNGQGLMTLIALGILRHLPLEEFGPDSADSIHLQLEAMKLGFADGFAHIAEPATMQLTASELLHPDRLKALAGTISLDQCLPPPPPVDPDRGTVYLCSGDKDGNMVSMIQSNYENFGSGIVVPGTGIALQNRANGFVLTEGHPNQVGGGKRPFHTIIPGFFTDDSGAVGPFGVMGGHMQAQGHVQQTLRLFQYGQTPQQALDAPRWFLSKSFEVSLETGHDPAVYAELEKRGHRLEKDYKWGTFGAGQTIIRRGGGLCAGSDPRRDGAAIGF